MNEPRYKKGQIFYEVYVYGGKVHWDEWHVRSVRKGIVCNPENFLDMGQKVQETRRLGVG